jgi:hypothetical protein
MSLEAMIDIETFDTATSAVVFQVGLITFDSTTGAVDQRFSWNLDVQAQLDEGRTVSASTLMFWLDPNISVVAGSSLASESTNLYELSLALVAALTDVKTIWAKGSFDFNLLEDLLSADYTSVPWKYYQLRELRTLLKECGVPKQTVVSHDALDDCEQQIKLLMECRKRIVAPVSSGATDQADHATMAAAMSTVSVASCGAA